MPDYFRICGKQRKSLVNDVTFLAELPHRPIPTQPSETAILHKRWSLGHLLQVTKMDIAHPEHASPPCVPFLSHGFPDFRIILSPAVSGGRTMQNVAVDVIRTEVLKRTRHGLSHLCAERRAGIIGQPMVLTRAIGELRLKKQFVAFAQ